MELLRQDGDLVRLQPCISEHALLVDDVPPASGRSQLEQLLVQHLAHEEDAFGDSLDVAAPLRVKGVVVQHRRHDTRPVVRRVRVHGANHQLKLAQHLGFGWNGGVDGCVRVERREKEIEREKRERKRDRDRDRELYIYIYVVFRDIAHSQRSLVSLQLHLIHLQALSWRPLVVLMTLYLSPYAPRASSILASALGAHRHSLE